MEEENLTIFGGLDLAQRVDFSALVGLQLIEKELHQVVDKIWPHIDYSNIFDDIEKIHNKIKFRMIGYDRTGVGDGLKHLMRPKNVFSPIVTSNNVKIQIINLVNGYFQKGILHIQPGTELDKQVREQSVDRSDAGNLIYRHPSNKHDDSFWALGYACLTASPYIEGFIRPRMAFPRNDFRDNLEDDAEATLEKILNNDI